jgi:hypothetical protein
LTALASHPPQNRHFPDEHFLLHDEVALMALLAVVLDPVILLAVAVGAKLALPQPRSNALRVEGMSASKLSEGIYFQTDATYSIF